MLCAELEKPAPDDLPLVIGDAFQCLRNSLDHIVFALSRKNPAMTAQDEDVPAFPIYDGAVRPNARAISLLDNAARDDVRDLAPDPARKPLNQDPLWLLHKMSNRDKHREVAIALNVEWQIGSYDLFESDGSDYFSTLSFGPQRLEGGTEPVVLAEVGGSPAVKAQVGISSKVIFDQGVEVANREVAPTLRWMHDHIRDTVFQRLEPHL